MVCLLLAIKKRYMHPKAIPISQPTTPPKNQLYTIASMLGVLSAYQGKTFRLRAKRKAGRCYENKP